MHKLLDKTDLAVGRSHVRGEQDEDERLPYPVIGEYEYGLHVRGEQDEDERRRLQ